MLAEGILGLYIQPIHHIGCTTQVKEKGGSDVLMCDWSYAIMSHGDLANATNSRRNCGVSLKRNGWAIRATEGKSEVKGYSSTTARPWVYI